MNESFVLLKKGTYGYCHFWCEPAQKSVQHSGRPPHIWPRYLIIYIGSGGGTCGSLLQPQLPADEAWLFWALMTALSINSNSAGGWITFDTKIGCFSTHIQSMHNLDVLGCMLRVSKVELTYMEAKPLCRTLCSAKNNKISQSCLCMSVMLLKIFLCDSCM